MPAEAAPIRQLARRLLRMHGLLIGAIVLATIQAGLVLSTTLRLLSEDQEKIYFHFLRLTGALEEQERFMRRWRAYDRTPDPGQPSPSAPYSIVHVEGSQAPATAFALGTLFSGVYNGFWAQSHYPSPRCLLVSGNGGTGLLVPSTFGHVDPPPASLRKMLVGAHDLAAHIAPQRDDLRWFPHQMDDGGVGLMAIVRTAHDAGLWAEGAEGAEGSVPSLACLLDMRQLDDHHQPLGEPIYDRLSIIDLTGRTIHGPLIPPGTAPREFGARGLVYRMRDSQGWQAVYHVGWGRVISQPRGPLIASVIVALFLALGGMLALRGYRRSVLEPLRVNHERLLESEAFSQTVLDAAPIGLRLLRHSDDNVILENALARDWLGEHEDAPSWLDASRNDASAGADAGRPASRPYNTPDGRHLLVTATDARYRGEPATLYLFIDLTLQHQAEQVLQQARRAADRANRAKSLFVATISHEIRTPLYGVLGTLELLGLTPLDNRQQEYVGTIQRSSSTLMQLISDILDMSKAEAGQLVLEPVAFCPSQLTEEVLRSYAGSATRKRLQLYGCIDGDIAPMVIGDAARIRQVLNNLVSNAIKFTDAGRIVMRLRMLEASGHAPRLSWQVADTGIGIQQEHQAHLFEPFYQANPGTDAMHGTGLGLAISAHLVTLMGGGLRVVSDSGLGSSFTFELTLAASPEPPEAQPLFARHETVYVRSPARELAESMCERLRRRGAAAQVFNLEAAQNVQPAIPLLDLSLDEPADAWAGPHVIARSDGGDHPEQVDGHWLASMHNLDAIVNALLLATGADAQLQSPAPATHYARLGLHVLVAEDNPINQMILREQLEQLGCHAVVASDGDEALGYWAQRRFDAILTDINMPHIDGYALTRRLRDSGVRVPIIGATANASPEERERCHAAGMDSCLVKPISLQALYRQLGALAVPGTAPEALAPDRAQACAGEARPEALKVSPHMRALFLSTMRSDMQDLARAADAGDLEGARQMLHRIRGALVMVLADRLADAAQEIEDSILSTPLAQDHARDAHAFLAQLERALVRLERAAPERQDAP